MRKTGYILCCLLLLCVACKKEKYYNGPTELVDGFETVTTAEQLYEAEGKWRFYQTTSTENKLELDTTNPHSGDQCLKFFATASVDGASKSDLAHNDLAFYEGETIDLSAWYYIESSANLNYIFLLDIEETVAVGAGPGTRFALEGKEGYLVVERNKYLQKTLRQNETTKIAFPRNEWVHLRVEMKLSRKTNGSIKVWQNKELIIDAANEQTLPKDELYFLQGTKGMYNSIQVGITAASPENEATVYVDDVAFITL